MLKNVPLLLEDNHSPSSQCFLQIFEDLSLTVPTTACSVLCLRSSGLLYLLVQTLSVRNPDKMKSGGVKNEHILLQNPIL